MTTDPTFRPSDSTRFEAAIRSFDRENSLDPNLVMVEGLGYPRELLYAERLTAWVLKLCPDAPEEVRLAARCQHICRWMVPRGSYEMTRAGYLKWRNDLKQFHANKAGEILRQTGYPEEIVAKVQALNLKKNFPKDPVSRALEAKEKPQSIVLVQSPNATTPPPPPPPSLEDTIYERKAYFQLSFESMSVTGNSLPALYSFNFNSRTWPRKQPTTRSSTRCKSRGRR